MLMQKVLAISMVFFFAGAAYGADGTAREKANERNAEAGRTSATPTGDCDRLQGPERTACLATGQKSPMGSGGSSGATAEKQAARHKQGHRASAKSKAKKSRASRSSSSPANEHADSGATPSGTSH